jgi:hypothetical protein
LLQSSESSIENTHHDLNTTYSKIIQQLKHYASRPARLQVEFFGSVPNAEARERKHLNRLTLEIVARALVERKKS